MYHFSYFSGNIKFVRPLGTVNIEQFVNAHKNPTPSTKELVDRIKDVKDKVIKRSLKGQLFAFTPSVTIIESRKYSNIVSFSGLAQLDFDKLGSVEAAIEFRDYIFETYPMIVCAYLSPSRNGVKCLIRIPKISIFKGIDVAIKEYKEYYRAIESEFGNYDGFDDSPKNPVLPLYISYDEDIRFRDATEVWDLKEEEPKPPPTLRSKPNVSYTYTGDYYYDKTVRLISTKINEIIDNGHPQVVRAFLVLGSRVGAGYIDKFDAERLAINLIESNEYLSKGTQGYIKTAMWAIDNGFKNPKYY